MSGRNASPEMTFGNIDAGYAPEYSNLESQAAQTGLKAQTQSQEFGANLLNNVLGSQENFGEWQAGARGKALQDYLNSLSSTSTFDDIMGAAGSLSKIPIDDKGGTALTGLYKGAKSIMPWNW
jgi:hypothetical protein